MDNSYTNTTGESDHVLAGWIHESSPNWQQRFITQENDIPVWIYNIRKNG